MDKPTEQEINEAVRAFCKSHPAADPTFIKSLVEELTRPRFEQLKKELGLVAQDGELRDG